VAEHAKRILVLRDGQIVKEERDHERRLQEHQEVNTV
jgi:hypothetical protein